MRGMLSDRCTALKFNGYTSDPILIDNGIGQGDPLSMVMYQFYNTDLLDIPREKSEGAIAYVDDTLLVATAEQFEEAHDKLASMMGREGGVTDWSKMHNSPLEYSKLALIDFAHRNSSKKRAPLQLPHRQVEPSTSTKYLGVILDQNLNWKAQWAHAVEKGMKWAMQIRRIVRPSWGITPKYARRLYISVALSRILYAADMWCVVACEERTEKSTIGPARTTSQMASIQRAGALAITGGLRTSPLDALNVHAHLLPVTTLVNKWCHGALTRMAALPEEHPLHKIMKSRRIGKTKKHKGPLHHLVKWFKIDINAMEKTPTVVRDPLKTGKLPFNISIAENREDSIKETEEALEEIQIFTDSSVLEGKVGAAVVLMHEGRHTQTLRYHLRPDSEHTVHEAELIGILLGLHILSTEKKSRKLAMIGVDNQAAIKAFDSELRNPGHHIVREALRIAEHLKKKYQRSKATTTIQWTAGHEGLEGNKVADREAKEAVKGHASETKLLPSYLRKPLLINTSTVKAAHNSKIKKEWQDRWKESE
jgi:ribonuclease HI